MEIGGQQWRATENCSTDKGLLLLLLFFFFFFLSFLLSFSSVIPWVTMMLRRKVVMPLIACKSSAIFVFNFSLMSSSSKLQSRWHVVVRHWVTVYFQARARGQQSMERFTGLRHGSAYRHIDLCRAEDVQYLFPRSFWQRQQHNTMSHWHCNVFVKRCALAPC